VYRNNGDGTFTDLGLGLPGVWQSSAAWGDYDSDGKLDFLLTGWDASNAAISELYRGGGDGTFTEIAGTGLPAVKNGAVAWGDYDSDGKPDVLLTGSTVSGGGVSGSVNAIYRNNGDGTFTDAAAGLGAMRGDSVAWGDYDSDGRLDIVETGDPTKLYRNVGGAFVENASAGLMNLTSGVVAWGDYDADGDLDLLLTGMDLVPARYAKVYANNGDGTFTSVADLLPQQGQEGAGGWGDYDADGDLDILLSGTDGGVGGYYSTVFRNDGLGTFTDSGAGLTGVANGGAAWGDYDSDGRLDIGLTGYYYDGVDGYMGWHRFAGIYRNDSATANTLPNAPVGLGYVAAGSQVQLLWSPASDAETPANALTYNLRVGTAPGSLDLVSPLALASGKRLVPAMGNAGHRTSFALTGLAGGTYYWSVQTVDSELAGSAFAAERAFTVPERFSFSAAAYSAGEAGGPVTVTITRLGSTLGPASVRFGAANGSATAGADFDVVDEVVGFASGEAQKTVSVTIRDDRVHEPSETVLLSLSSPSQGATLGDPSAATITIGDDENGRIASARLTSTSFRSTRAAKVKLLYKVEPSSKTVDYRLSRKSGSRWVTVRSVRKSGVFAGPYSLTVKQLFGAKRIRLGAYRVKLSAETNWKLLDFRVN